VDVIDAYIDTIQENRSLIVQVEEEFEDKDKPNHITSQKF
jgi:hypothetical protein